MKLRNLLVVPAAAAVLLGGPAISAMASAPAHHRGLLTVTYQESAGNGYGIGSPSAAAGNQVLQVTPPGRQFQWNPTTFFQGDAAGTLRSSAGTYVATNANCTGLVYKATPTQDGTVFADHVTSSGKHQIVSRFCSGAGSMVVVAGDGHTLNQQYGLCDLGSINFTCTANDFRNFLRQSFA